MKILLTFALTKLLNEKVSNMNQDKEHTEQKILAAAEAEFMTKGFAGAKTMSIAEAAGVTHAMLHYYYRTKEKLFMQVYEEKVQTLANSVVEAFGQEGASFTERIAEGIRRHFDFITANPLLPRFLVLEVLGNPERVEIVKQHIGKLFVLSTKSMQTEADILAERGEICRINITDLLIDIASLNVFTFIALPAIEPFVTSENFSRENFLEHRKQENVEVIMRRLKP